MKWRYFVNLFIERPLYTAYTINSQYFAAAKANCYHTSCDNNGPSTVLNLRINAADVHRSKKLHTRFLLVDGVSTAMGDCLRAGKPSRREACQLGQLSLLPSVGR